MSVGHGRVRGLGRQHGHMNVVAGGSGEGRCGLMVAVHRRSDDRGFEVEDMVVEAAGQCACGSGRAA